MADAQPHTVPKEQKAKTTWTWISPGPLYTVFGNQSKMSAFPGGGTEGMWAWLKETESRGHSSLRIPSHHCRMPALGNSLQLDPSFPLTSHAQKWTFLLFNLLTFQNCTNNFQTSRPLLGTQSSLSTKELKISRIISFSSTNISSLLCQGLYSVLENINRR